MISSDEEATVPQVVVAFGWNYFLVEPHTDKTGSGGAPSEGLRTPCQRFWYST